MTKQPNIVIIIVDTLRFDASFADDGVLPVFQQIKENISQWNVFKNCISPSSWTLPSHASIFTGQYPSRNGVIEDINHNLTDYSYLYDNYGGPKLADTLKLAGYKTYSFCQNNLVGADQAFMAGFDEVVYSANTFQQTYDTMHKTLNNIYDNWGSSKKDALFKSLRRHDTISLLQEFYKLKKTSMYLERLDMSRKGARELLSNLKREKLEEPFLIFINLMEMHDPHDKFSLSIGWQDTVFGDNSFPESSISELRKAYFRAVSEVDQFLSGLISYLKNLGKFDDTLIVVTSDHGQSLFEDNYFGHCNFLYDSIVKVPLFIKLPQNKRMKINSGYQSTVRIFPFIKENLESNEFYDTITEDTVFSECNGFFDPIVKKYRGTKHFQEIYDRFNIPTKAIYSDNYKLVYDFKNFKVTEFMKDGIKADPKEETSKIKELLEQLSIFSNMKL